MDRHRHADLGVVAQGILDGREGLGRAVGKGRIVDRVHRVDIDRHARPGHAEHGRSGCIARSRRRDQSDAGPLTDRKNQGARVGSPACSGNWTDCTVAIVVSELVSATVNDSSGPCPSAGAPAGAEVRTNSDTARPPRRSCRD